MSDPVMPMPVEATVPLPKADPEKEVMLRAAVMYDRAKEEREKLLKMVEDATNGLNAREARIETLETALKEERDRYGFLEKAYHESIQDRADLEALLAVEQDHHEERAARLAKFEFSRLRRRRGNGKRGADSHGGLNAVSDALAGQGEVVDVAPVVAPEQGQ